MSDTPVYTGLLDELRKAHKSTRPITTVPEKWTIEEAHRKADSRVRAALRKKTKVTARV